MKPYLASLINAITLIVISVWAYFGASTPSLTALIPALFGIILLALLPGVKSDNKVIAHIAVVITLVVFLALMMPLRGALAREDAMAMLRIGLMMASTLFAMIFFIKSFIDVRKARNSG
jgi:hypothetical protein